MARAEAAPPVLGLRANAIPFGLLVLDNALVGAMVGLERSVLPLLAEREFGVATATVTLSFLTAFGLTKAAANLVAGRIAGRVGRKRLLVAGWVAALPVPALVAWAPSWRWIVGANVLLGINQGLAWSMTVLMKVDLVGPRRRGLALGLNEAAGYGAVALAALGSAALATSLHPRSVIVVLGAAVAGCGLLLSATLVPDTAAHVEVESRAPGPSPPPRRGRSFAAACQAGLVNNLNDAMAWGLLPIFLTAEGLALRRVGVVAAVYPGTWAATQAFTGALSDRAGRKPLIVAGMLVQAAAIACFVAVSSFGLWVAAAAAMGLGTALVYPALLAVVGDGAGPRERPAALGAYRFWRDLGYAAGGLLVGAVADAAGARGAVVVVAGLTAASGIWVAVRLDETLPSRAGAAPRTGRVASWRRRP